MYADYTLPISFILWYKTAFSNLVWFWWESDFIDEQLKNDSNPIQTLLTR